MNIVKAYRYRSSDQGTFSRWLCEEIGFDSFCIELPWRNNESGYSCIPVGKYIVSIRKSPKYGHIFHVTDVNGRSWILIHSGNFAGDTKRGYKTHSLGCILLGQKPGVLNGQQAILNSKSTVHKFMRLINYETFELHIINLKAA